MKKTLLISIGLFSSFAINAQIIYYDVDPDSVITGLVTYDTGDSYFLDLDQNGSIDYHLVKVSYSSPDPDWDFGYIQDGGSGPGTNEFLGEDPGTGLREVFNLNAGDPIDASGIWSTVAGGNSAFINVFPGAGAEDGEWLMDDDGYAGLRFDSSGTECYAWLRMGFADDHSTMTIKDWAYSCDGSLTEAGEMPTVPCEAPADLTVSSVTINSADLGWTELNGATEWEVEWGLGGFSTGTGTAVVTSSNPYSLSALDDDTAYDFYVRSICGVGDTSEWSTLGTFETILDDVGVEEQSGTELNVYPNPMIDLVNFQFNRVLNAEIKIYDLIGKEVLEFELIGESHFVLDVSDLPHGRYVYQLKTEDVVLNGQLLKK